MSYQLEDVVFIAETQLARLVRFKGTLPDEAEDEVNQFWLPLSQIEDSDLEEIGDEGCVEISDWLAKRLGLEH